MANTEDKPDPKHVEMLNELARGLDSVLNPNDERKFGFVLFLFEFSDNVRVNYISNAIRRDMIAVVESWLKRVKEGVRDN